MKIKPNTLHESLFWGSLKSKLLMEEDKLKGEKDSGQASLDDQVDRLLISYEKEAKNLKTEGLDFRMMVRRLMTEAPEDEEKEADDETNEKKGEPKKLTIEDIDVNSFAESVVRLIDNYESLLEIRDTLVRRSRNFLKKGYSDDVVSSFMSFLRDNYDIELGVDDVDKRFDVKVPNADRAGKSGE